MKRNELVQRLIKEGFSEKTLVNFSDKQLSELSERVLGEAVMKQVKVLSMSNPKDAEEVNTIINDPNKVKTMSQQGHVQVTKEEKGKLSKNQSNKMDTDKDGDIDSKDLKNLRNKNKKVGVKKEKPSTNKKEVKEWVKGLAESNYHSFTSKSEIMELIQSKMTQHEVGPNVKKGHNGVPEFMSYDSIANSEVTESGTKTKPVTKPTTKPSTPKPKTPYNPGPGKNPKPKALKEDK